MFQEQKSQEREFFYIKEDIVVKLNFFWNPHRKKIQIHKKIYHRNLHKI